ncbi:MAG: DUF4070 domain-containing protein [Candidatus Woesearchaeota archaeon]
MGARAVLINPASNENTFWSMWRARDALLPNQYGGRKATYPPLALLMIGGYLKRDERFDKNDKDSVVLIDRNVDQRPLSENPHLKKADLVLVGVWSSLLEDFIQNVAPVVNGMGKDITLGGRSIDEKFLARTKYDRAVIGEAEPVMPKLLDDFFNGRKNMVYVGGHTPPKDFLVPDYTLIDMGNYVDAILQFSRGCAFDCEFCNITEVDGKKPRYGTDEYVRACLEEIIATGFRSSIFIADDNLIGHPREASRVLKATNEVEREYRIYLPKYTQLSLNISEMPAELLEEMREARFVKAFVGIETNNEPALNAAGKSQNTKGELSVKEKIGNFNKKTGITLYSGGIIGFDQDSAKTIRSLIEFFKKLPIPTIMAGLLTAPERTRLYTRLVREGRLMAESSLNNTGGRTNFIPMLMSEKELEEFYIIVQEELFNPKAYFKRFNGYLELSNPKKLSSKRSVKESLYSLKKIYVTGPNKWTSWRHLPGGLVSIVKNVIRHRNFRPSHVIRLLGEIPTGCAQYTNYKGELDSLKEERKGWTHEPWQLYSWIDIQAAKVVNVKVLQPAEVPVAERVSVKLGNGYELAGTRIGVLRDFTGFFLMEGLKGLKDRTPSLEDFINLEVEAFRKAHDKKPEILGNIAFPEAERYLRETLPVQPNYVNDMKSLRKYAVKC